jgi:hypothetical protein
MEPRRSTGSSRGPGVAEVHGLFVRTPVTSIIVTSRRLEAAGTRGR